MSNKIWATLTIVTSIMALAACIGPATPATPTPPQLADELVIASWPEDQISVVFDAFTQEYGVKLALHAYDSQEEAIEEIKTGQVYDVVVIENRSIPSLIAEGLLARIDRHHVPNYKNISPNFRNLAYDPDNRYTIPYSWGTSGLVVRDDLVEEPVTRWADLWDPRYAGRVVLWTSTPRFTLGTALLSLGYPVNSEDPAQLEAALERLLELKPRAIWLDEQESSAPWLVSGEAVMALGWAYDVWTAQEQNDNVSYVLPEEGTMLWGDNFVIPANSPQKYTAELFLNFILRPEITGQLVNANFYPMPNDAATPFIEARILDDPVIYPGNEQMKNAQLILPLSPPGERLHQEIWERFMAKEVK